MVGPALYIQYGIGVFVRKTEANGGEKMGRYWVHCLNTIASNIISAFRAYERADGSGVGKVLLQDETRLLERARRGWHRRSVIEYELETQDIDSIGW